MAYLLFEDGKSFRGSTLLGEAHGECVVYNGKDSHREVLFNPALFKKIVIYSFPHATFDCAAANAEKTMAAGIIGKDISAGGEGSARLQEYLQSNGIGGIAGLDTRLLTHYIREHGIQTAAIAETEERCAHILRFPPEPERAYTQETSWEPMHKVALIDLGITNTQHDFFRERISFDIFNPEITLDELDGYNAYIIAGGCEDYLPLFEGLMPGLIEQEKPMLGFGLGHMLMAKGFGWEVEKDRFYFGPNQAAKRRETDRVIYADRADWYTMGGRGTGRVIYQDMDAKNGISGLMYAGQCLSLGFEPEGYPEVNDFFRHVGGGANA